MIKNNNVDSKKRNSKITSKIFISVISATLVASFVTSIGLSIKVDPVYSPTNPSGVKFISERTMSLSFQTDRGDALTGTGWIMSKVNDDVNDFRYYVGTNLHVASAINNMGKSAHTYKDGSYTLTTIPNFNSLYIGQIISKNVDGNKTYDVGVVSGKSTEFGYWNRLPITSTNDANVSNVSVAWTTFDIFNNQQFADPYNIYNQTTIENATMDFAVLEINFDPDQYKLINSPTVENFNPIQKMLENYTNNPTKFADKYKDNEAITIGGFPIYGSKNNMPNAVWETAENIYSNERYYGLILNRSDWKSNIDETDDNKIKKEYTLRLDIQYITDSYAGYRNVANQVLFSNLNLASGSSGSMAVNANNEVVGIYWGTYGATNTTFGTIDLFKSFNWNKVTYEYKDLNKTYPVSYGYDIITSFNESFPNNSLTK